MKQVTTTDDLYIGQRVYNKNIDIFAKVTKVVEDGAELEHEHPLPHYIETVPLSHIYIIT